MVNEVMAQLADAGEYLGGLQLGGVAVEVIPIFVLWGVIFCVGLAFLLKRGYGKKVIFSYILLFTTLSFIGDIRLVTSNSIEFRFYNWDYVWLVWFVLILAAASFFIWLSRKKISERFLTTAQV
jgi:hypothetical protein